MGYVPRPIRRAVYVLSLASFSDSLRALFRGTSATTLKWISIETKPQLGIQFVTDCIYNRHNKMPLSLVNS